MPKFSIIVPIYNAEKYLKKCLDSIINQTFKNFEIIAIDDGSTDNSFEILERYQEKYKKKIRCFKNENSGVAITRNFGLKKVTRRIFYFCRCR